MTAFYNEIDPFAAQWLRNLIDAGHIASGVVDERDIRDITPEELAGFTQCHFFAGIGVWSCALRQAGWPDDAPVWTGSCPCQPFSAAGKGNGFVDERHLFPDWYHLVAECRPATIFGEQVASKDGLNWYDLVQADLEGAGYAVGAADMCAAGVGAPHIRQRLWFVAERLEHPPGDRRLARRPEPSRGRTASRCGENGLGYAVGTRLEGHARDANRTARRTFSDRPVAAAGCPSRVADAPSERRGETWSVGHGPAQRDTDGSATVPTHPTNGFWRDADWLFCRDEKWRPVEPGTFPLVDGVAGRVGRLRAYGNAIVAPTAQAFIEAYLECAQLSIEVAA